MDIDELREILKTVREGQTIILTLGKTQRAFTLLNELLELERISQIIMATETKERIRALLAKQSWDGDDRRFEIKRGERFEPEFVLAALKIYSGEIEQVEVS